VRADRIPRLQGSRAALLWLPLLPLGASLPVRAPTGSGIQQCSTGRRGEAAVVACGKLSTAAQRQLLEDVGEMCLHGCLGDPEPTRGLEIAEPIDNKVHDLLLSSAQSFAEG
jgi:hypothetical protein